MPSELEQFRHQLNALTADNAAQIAALKADNASLRAEVSHIQTQSQRERRLRLQAGLALVAFLAAIFLSPGNRTAIAQGYGLTLATLNTRLMAVEAKTQFQSADVAAKSTTFTGCNVYIQSGSNSTSDGTADLRGFPLNNGKSLTGLGNLIIGYNATGHISYNSDITTSGRVAIT